MSNNLPMLPADPGISPADPVSGSLPVKTGDDFIAEFEVMDISSLKDKTFMVAVSREDRNKGKFICTTAHGPYDFYEMVEEVGTMWREHQHHAKVYIMEKDRSKRAKYLDQNTTDYIEAHHADLIVEGMLDGAFDESKKEYTCRANVVEDDGEENPLKEKAILPPKDDDEDAP